MLNRAVVQRVIALYPRMLTACRSRHTRSDSGVSQHQAGVLSQLDIREPTSLKQLAHRTGVTPSTMSLTIDRLVKRGYVRRELDENDRRRICLRLTESGDDIKGSYSLLDEERVARLLERLPPNKRRQAVRGLAILARAAEELDRERRSKAE